MREHSVKKMIFSSSAAVYSPENTPPYSEESKCGPQNPYATTKLCIEYILQDYVRHHGMRIKALRYFNPI
jgi:UDP-glucose 4-epimerase